MLVCVVSFESQTPAMSFDNTDKKRKFILAAEIVVYIVIVVVVILIVNLI